MTTFALVDEATAYICCLHCSCPTRTGHPVPCRKCNQPLRMTRDRLVARVHEPPLLGRGRQRRSHDVHGEGRPQGRSSPSGVPAPPPHISWSAPDDKDGDAPVTHRRWWDPRPTGPNS